MEKIALIGLTPKSVSVGIALENANLKNTKIVGMDIRRNINKQVKKLKLISEVTDSYAKAVMDSNLVIIDVPTRNIKWIARQCSNRRLLFIKIPCD